jgi:hypothetical protein
LIVTTSARLTALETVARSRISEFPAVGTTVLDAEPVVLFTNVVMLPLQVPNDSFQLPPTHAARVATAPPVPVMLTE